MAKADPWRAWINNLKVEDLPENGEVAPTQEMIVNKKKSSSVFVRKLITVTYLYSDVENMVYGHTVFEDVTVYGDMPPDRLEKMLEKESRKRKPADPS